MTRRPLVAIDGPAGSGKSTVAQLVSAHLGARLLDTGAMYRAVTLAVLETGTDPADGPAAERLAEKMELSLGERVLLDGRDVTEEIRSPEVDAVVSTVSAHPELRRLLVERQRAWAEDGEGGVAEGRDTGTVVFPDADLKVYLTADPEVRARRRDLQRGEGALSTAETARQLARRDAADSGRQVSPLFAAHDAVVIDSTYMTPEDVVEKVLSLL